mgnify:CR=1 FL=1
MPTLDDSPILETLTSVEFEADVAGTATSIATQDLILIYDVSEQKIKTITAAALMNCFNDTTVDPTP